MHDPFSAPKLVEVGTHPIAKTVSVFFLAVPEIALAQVVFLETRKRLVGKPMLNGINFTSLHGMLIGLLILAVSKRIDPDGLIRSHGLL